jgi:carbamoyltransferase
VRTEIILGIGGYTTDASVCLMADGELLGAQEEERFSRVKHSGGWPRLALARLLKDHGIRESEITHIAFSYDPWLRISRRVPYRLTMVPSKPLVSGLLIFNELKFVAEFMARLRSLRMKSGARLSYVRHHLLHAASAFLGSPFDEAAIYTADQRGEWDTTLLSRGRGTSIEILGHTGYPHSLGIFYSGITRHLGFGDFDEYKVMGLASYGTPRYVEQLRRVIFPSGQDRFRIDTSYLQYHRDRGLFGGSFFTRKFEDLAGPPRLPDTAVTEHHMDLAASAQKVFEECVFHQLNALHAKAPSENLCVAGGCGLNGAMTGRISANTPFRHVFVPSVSGDDGLSLGGALHLRHSVLGHPRVRPLWRADLGTSYSDEQIGAVLDLYKLKYVKVRDIVPPTVDLLVRGRIVGWFQGRMEFGARALGFRSILANPTMPDMKDTLNKFVKFREEFRPFAPSVCAEAAGRYFEMSDPIPFMTSVCAVRPEGAAALPATTHVDGTARVQTVDRDSSPLYWRLIDAFGASTGVPVVLNTSFNVMGEPLVESPSQAIRCYYSCGMDVLALGSYLLAKRESDLPTS